MTITFVDDAQTVNGTAGTSCVVTKPTGTVDDHVMLAVVAINTNGAITPPAGWTEIDTAVDGNSRMTAWYRVADSEGTDYTFTFASSRNWGWIGSYAGVDIALVIEDPLHVHTNQGFKDSNGADAVGPSSVNGVGILHSRFKDYLRVLAVANTRAATGVATTYVGGAGEKADMSTNAGAGTDVSGVIVTDVLTVDGRFTAGSVDSSQDTDTSVTMNFILKPAMTPYPGGMPEVIVRAAFGADPDGDPDDWTWTELTYTDAAGNVKSRVLHQSGIDIFEGTQNEAGRPSPSSIALTLRNHDAALTPENPMSEFWPNVIERLPIQVLVPYGYPGQTELGTCFVASYSPEWLDTTAGVPQLAVVAITATGRKRPMQQGNPPLLPPLDRALLTSGGNAAPPAEFWPCTDGIESINATSAVGGFDATASNVTFSGSNDVIGGDSLLTFAVTSLLNGIVRPYTNTGQWTWLFVTMLEASPGGNVTIAEVTSTGTAARWQLVLRPDFFGAGQDALTLFVYNAAGTLLATHNGLITDPSDYGIPTVIAINAATDGTGVEISLRMSQGAAASSGSSPATLAANTHGIPNQWTIFGSTVLDTSPVGYVTVITTTDYDQVDDLLTNIGPAIIGHSGEARIVRFNRLLDEEGIQRSSIAAPSVLEPFMGPQQPATLLSLLEEIEDVFLGTTIHDGGANGSMLFTGHEYRQDAQVRITLDMAQRQLARGFRPVFDDQRRRDAIRISRPGGGAATASASDKPAFVFDKSVNIDDDAYLYVIAGGRLAIGQAPGARYPQIQTLLHRTPGLAEQVLRTRIGSRLQVTNLMAAHPATSIVDSFIEGRRHRIDNETWIVTYVTSPASPWDTAIVEDDAFGRLDSDECILVTAVDDNDTALDVAFTNGGPLATVDADEWTAPAELYLDLGGVGRVRAEKVKVTDIDSSVVTTVASGTTDDDDNATVTPGIPGGLAVGNLLLMLASIRNSGTGTVDTPAGWLKIAPEGPDVNVALLAKIAEAADLIAATPVTFTGGVAGATTSVVVARLDGLWYDVDGIVVTRPVSMLNPSAADIAYPSAWPNQPNVVLIYWFWKQDNATGTITTFPGTQISQVSTTTGDDSLLTWSYLIQTDHEPEANGNLTVPGSAAISRSGVVGIRCDRQAITVDRSQNDVVMEHGVSSTVRLWDGAYPATL